MKTVKVLNSENQIVEAQRLAPQEVVVFEELVEFFRSIGHMYRANEYAAKLFKEFEIYPREFSQAYYDAIQESDYPMVSRRSVAAPIQESPEEGKALDDSFDALPPLPDSE